MTQPSVEEIVRAYETAKALGLPQNYLGREYADALIADWRKRGEALANAQDDIDLIEMWLAGRGELEIFRSHRAALTQQQPPAV